MTATRTPSSALDLFDLTGRSALITGASGALGSAAARALASAGAHVTLAAGSSEKLDEVASEVERLGGRAERFVRRPECPGDAEEMVQAAVRATGRLDIVIAASGVNIVTPTTEMSDADWRTVMDANVRGSWLVSQAAGRQMIDQGEGGKVILISSTRGQLGHPAGYSAYCPSKAAVDGLTRALACEWGRHAITVNAIGPTVFRSDLTAWMYTEEGQGRAVREAILQRIPIGRLGEPDDFAGALVFLGSRASDFVTGQVLYVDGGYTAG